MSEQWIVTGGTGVVGRALVSSLLADGHRVTILSRSPAAQQGGLRTVQWTPTTAGPWQSEIDGSDVVVHLAGAGIGDSRWTEARLREIKDSRIASGKLIASAVARAAKKPAVYVSASAVGYYGAHDEGETLEEGSAAGSDTLASICREWEASADAARDGGVPVAHPRLGVVLSREGGALAKMLPPFRAYVGGPIGSGKQWMSWIHVEDVVRAIRFIAARRIEGPVNVTAETPVTMDTFAKTVGEALHRPSALRAPALALRLALGEMSDIVLKGQRVLPTRLLRDGFAFEHKTLRGALESLLA